MVSNRNLALLADVPEIGALWARAGLQWHNVHSADHCSLLLVHGSYVVELSEALRDNGVMITLADAAARLWVPAQGAVAICKRLGIAAPVLALSPESARSVRDVFLSNLDDKLALLSQEMPPVLALLAHAGGQGGLGAVARLAPPRPFQHHPYVRALPVERLALYRLAIEQGAAL